MMIVCKATILTPLHDQQTALDSAAGLNNAIAMPHALHDEGKAALLLDVACQAKAGSP